MTDNTNRLHDHVNYDTSYTRIHGQPSRQLNIYNVRFSKQMKVMAYKNCVKCLLSRLTLKLVVQHEFASVYCVFQFRCEQSYYTLCMAEKRPVGAAKMYKKTLEMIQLSQINKYYSHTTC